MITAILNPHDMHEDKHLDHRPLEMADYIYLAYILILYILILPNKKLE